MIATPADRDVVAVSAVRTPMGRFGGSFRDLPAYELGAAAIAAAVERAGLAPGDVDDVVLGHCRQAGSGTNPARTAARLAGIPAHVPATTVTMACAAGTRAAILGAQSLQLEEARFVVVGGMESMSTIPYLLLDARWHGLRRGDRTLVDGWHDSRDPFVDDIGTGQVTENLVARHGISRAEQDEFALESQRKAATAARYGLFAEEIVPVPVPADGNGGGEFLDHDECIRPDTTLEQLAELPPAFRPDGTLTAGNSSGLTDGASAIVLTTRAIARRRGLEPLFSIVSHAIGAVDNACMGEGPSVGLPKALERAKLGLHDLDFIEVNEAFAGMVLANERLLHWDRSKLNRHGGAIALGHPVGCSGARVLVTLYHVLKHHDGELGAAAVGAAGGVTAALVMRRER
ncbi:MAG TPA: thiolase family protein [Verrucomicrobiae bacterium]|nr:thiolase family protein [Verrucomicrobiae bacterium]